MQSLAIHCLFEGRNQQIAKTHIYMWPDRSDSSEVETHIVQIGHILDLDLDKKETFLLEEGDKRSGDPGVCHRGHCPRASLWHHRHICTCVFAYLQGQTAHSKLRLLPRHGPAPPSPKRARMEEQERLGV